MNRWYSVMKFGSVARGSCDDKSDLDMLIAFDSQRTSKKELRALGMDGASYNIYAYSQLERMGAAGSLFLEHLKREGSMIRDSNGRLAKILKDFRPRTSYQREINEQRHLFRVLERFEQCKSLAEATLAADVAYVAFRNMMILEFASHGKYVFDYNRLIEMKVRAKGLSQDEFRLLQALRELKWSYRRNDLSTVPISASVGDLQKTIRRCFGDGSIKTSRICTPIRDLRNGYFVLRDFEAAAFVALGRRAEPSDFSHPALRHAAGLAACPRGYSFSIRRSYRSLIGISVECDLSNAA